MGVVNTIHSRTETNEQNALIERHLCLIATGITMREFRWNVAEKLLDTHSCKDRNCRVCTLRFPRDLALVAAILSDGASLKTINLFSKWAPSYPLEAKLKADEISIAWHPLSDIPSAHLEANRRYSIWDGNEAHTQRVSRDVLVTGLVRDYVKSSKYAGETCLI